MSLQSEISHLSVTSLTGQAAISDSTVQLLLGGFSSFFLFSKHLKRQLQENQHFQPCFPPISMKRCVFMLAVVLGPDNCFIIYSKAALLAVSCKQQILPLFYFVCPKSLLSPFRGSDTLPLFFDSTPTEASLWCRSHCC